MNNPLIEQIYDRKKESYKDIRHLHTEKTMTRRLDEIHRLINKIPVEKRVIATNKKYKLLVWEQRLLTFKKAIYLDKGAVMAMTRFTLQASDRYSWEGRADTNSIREAASKKAHILPLLNLVLIKKTDDELRQILAL